MRQEIEGVIDLEIRVIEVPVFYLTSVKRAQSTK